MTRLSYNRVDNVKSGNFIFRFALEDKLLDILDDVFIELDGFHRCFGDGSHLCFGYRDFVVVERKKLKIKLDVIKITSNQ